MRIETLDPSDAPAVEQAATILNLAFREHWPDSWAVMDEARQEIAEMLAPDRILRVAKNDAGVVVGLIGGIPEYDGHVWELHPLAIHPNFQKQGIGRLLVHDFEAQVKARGGLTIQLGSDDVDDMTTLANVNLYEHTWEHIRGIQNLKGHPYTFYQKLGYIIIGVMPDANGRGKPDILMGKSVE